MNSQEGLRTHRPARYTLGRILLRARDGPRLRTAIVNPVDEMDLRAVEAADFVDAVLVGAKKAITRAASLAGISADRYTVIDAADPSEAARVAAELARRGEVDALMKGSLHSDEFLRAVVAEPELRTSRRMSHVAVLDAPALPHLIFISDSAVNIAPTLDEKRDITQNAIDVARAVGVVLPKVAILSAVETVSSREPSTIDAAALAKMADRQQITGAFVDGPLALDDALSPEAARIKGIVSPVAGCADILIAPNLDAANVLFKEIEYLGRGTCACVVAGARIPLVLTGRADDAATRVASLALASVVRSL
ncbi:MAG TPA: bifunctional enoyl-CoA hydratase/phosphate acetyltransferase [Candidatus Acidoferrales bacterium]|nr:bifunctional enoyl-CoA hydratase/phosphate acetyltransferase [Candidatus Acidoferrales bacterium]